MDYISKSARLSEDGMYRYELRRLWDFDKAVLPFVMLNPSTADHNVDDPTIRRCVSFAAREGYGGIVVANLYAFRATNPCELNLIGDPAGPRNLDTLRRIAHDYGTVVCAWGSFPAIDQAHVHDVLSMIGYCASLLCLGKTKSGAPRHPLYVRSDQPFEAYP